MHSFKQTQFRCFPIATITLVGTPRLESIFSKAKNLGKKLVSAVPLTSALLAPYLASQPAYAQADAENPTNAPIVFWMESRNLNKWTTRHFNKNLGAGEGIGLIIYADNTLSSNIVGGIEFEVDYPTNNVNFEGPSNLTPYIKNSYGLNSTNDFFFQAPMSSVNQAGLKTQRFVSSGTQASQLKNQNPPGKKPVAILNFRTYPNNQSGLCSFNIKNTKAYDLNENLIPSAGTHMSVNIIDDFRYYDDVLGKNPAIIMDMNEIQGKKVPFIFVDAYYPYINTLFQLKKSTNVQNWHTIKESYPKSGVNYIGDFIDWSASTNNTGFYKVTR